MPPEALTTQGRMGYPEGLAEEPVFEVAEFRVVERVVIVPDLHVGNRFLEGFKFPILGGTCPPNPLAKHSISIQLMHALPLSKPLIEVAKARLRIPAKNSSTGSDSRSRLGRKDVSDLGFDPLHLHLLHEGKLGHEKTGGLFEEPPLTETQLLAPLSRYKSRKTLAT